MPNPGDEHAAGDLPEEPQCPYCGDHYNPECTWPGHDGLPVDPAVFDRMEQRKDEELVSWFCTKEHNWDTEEESTYCLDCGLNRQQAEELANLITFVREAYIVLRYLCHEDGCAALYDENNMPLEFAFPWDASQDDPRCDCGMAESLAAYLAAKKRVEQWLQVEEKHG